MNKYLVLMALFNSLLVGITVTAEEEEKERYIITTTKTEDAVSISTYSEIASTPSTTMSVGEFTPTEIEQIKSNSETIRVEKDAVVTSHEQQEAWGYKKLNHPKVNTKLTGKGVKIAVLDSGIDLSHEDLIVTGGKSFIGRDTYNDEGGHGTHVAGIIAAQNNNLGLRGISPDAHIYALQVLDENGKGYVSYLVDAIEWSIANDMDIINMSLGTKTDVVALKEVLQRADDAGILIVVAAGNNGDANGTNDVVQYPAFYESVIAVGSVDGNLLRSKFSSTGNNVDIAAPGRTIYSTYKGNIYNVLSGTSMATPYVSGALALYKEAFPELSNQKLKELLYSSTLDLGVKGKDKFYGYGLVQLPEKESEPEPLPIPEQPPLAPKPSITTKLPFSDVGASYWGREGITLVYEKGWMLGVNSKKFGVSMPLTRAQVAVVLTRVMGLTPVQPTVAASFKDIGKSHWAFKEIEIVKQHNIFNGYKNGVFNSNQGITRAQMAEVLNNALKLSITNSNEPAFKDVTKSHPNYRAILALKQHGILSGDKDGYFKPNQVLTRGEMAALLYRGVSYFPE